MLDFSVRGQTEWSQFQVVFTPTMLRGEVIAVLSQRVDVIDVAIETGDTIITGTLPWSYTARVRVRTRVAHAQASDVGSIVANAFYQGSGTMPTVTIGSGGLGSGELPRTPGQLPGIPVTTTIVVAAVALLVLAWKF